MAESNNIFNHKLLFIRTFTLIILTLNAHFAFAQLFDSEQYPPSVKWGQINTNGFRIIYPIELGSEAQRMAATLDHIVQAVSKSLNKKPRKISIILQNQTVVSNGFVQLAPRRSEFNTLPPQSQDFQDWLNSLAIHELRHVVQIDKLSGKLKAPLFEELALAFFGISLPAWFFEGDAVGIETTLSHAGRGRLPEWEQIFRTNTLSGKNYSYSKNYLGSMKDRTPGYYQLGYFMTTKLRRDYGAGILDSIMSRIATFPLRPYNLSNSMKKFTGMGTKTLHDTTLSELRQLWQNQAGLTGAINYPSLNTRKNKIPSEYLFPVRLEDGSLLSLKHSFAHTPALVRIDTSNTEHTVLQIGFQTEPNFKYAAGKVVWDELRFDNRFYKRSFSVINTYDLRSKKFKQLSQKSRMFSPAISADGSKIAVVNADLAGKFNLLELNADNGEIIKEYKIPDGLNLQTPSYNEDGTKIICAVTGKEGTGLMEFNTHTSENRLIIPFQRQQISRPVYADQLILFRAHYNGISNIYSISSDHSIAQITSSAYGANNPSYDIDKNTVLFNTEQIHGYDIAQIDLRNNPAIPIQEIKNNFIDYASPLVMQESNAKVLDSVPEKIYTQQSYNEAGKLFNFHSLSPTLNENELTDELNIGFKLKSNNVLNTLSFYTGYRFNSGLKRSEYVGGLAYKRLYTIFDLKYINRARLVYARQNNNLIPVNWRENFTELQIDVPFTSNRLNNILNMGFRSSVSYTGRYQIINRPLNFNENLQFPISYQFYFSRNNQRSLRDLAPRWGQNISVSYFHLPFENQLNGSLFALRSNFYTPGLSSNHSFRTSFNYQKSTGAYEFNIEIPRVSGFNYIAQSAKLSNTLLFDYAFPLFYPDAEIGSLAYIKRLSAGLFADFMNLGDNTDFSPVSYGIELNSRMNFLRFLAPEFDLSTKIIFIHKQQNNAPVVEFGLNYNF